MRARMVYAWLVLFVTMLGVGLLNVAYTNYVDERRVAGERAAKEAAQKASRSQACALVVAFDELYKESPPTTPAGQRVAALWSAYRAQLGC